MSEEVTNIVKKVSNGMVKIPLEQYQELIEKAAEKAPVVYRTVQKTPEMVANENKMWGAVFLSGGIFFSVLGGVMHTVGRSQAKNL